MDLFLLGSTPLGEPELLRHLRAVDDLLARGESLEPGVLPGRLVWDVAAGEAERVRRDLDALSERVRGLGAALLQTWAGGALVGDAYRLTAHSCLLTPEGDALLWRRAHSLWVVDSRSKARKPFNPWRSVAWVA